MIRAVIDTNIIVSGLLFGGIPRKIINSALMKQFVWVTSPALLEETEKVLKSKKFGLLVQEIQALTRPIFETVELVVPQKRIDIIKRCPADNRVLECAFEGHCSVIVTGDHRDLISIKSFRNISILTARQFFEEL